MNGWRAAFAGAVLLALEGFGNPAAAQLLDRGDSSYLSAGVGVFDFAHDRTAGEFLAEYRSGTRLLGLLKPFVGGMVTTDSAVYGYGGFGIDLYLGDHFVLTPNAAIGLFDDGDGKDLGSFVEFRTGAELAWRFDDRSRLGVAFHHISNAGLTERNPGTETLMFVYSHPLSLFK